ncbi:DHHC zinc finger domain containing protein [Tritrichomonas foetus]|uniref:Palmitoyltransferase n=1 Tax=Tritrichomonas foetus TaxID=1144522 RepID=A0A1J4KKN4_9EUKA|nr:DHHC zinc finger domain containing protein [Tritrichomonas foetus]|eukprot:OHT11855.1 DHHC zinc finger domain containing protein [Tritrichomonas foetus]
MDFVCCCTRVCPNTFVLIFAGLLGYASILVVFPKLVFESNHPLIFAFIGIIVVASFSMFIWCWITAATMDPGRVKDDLEARGLLKRIQRGDIPECLRDLPICMRCNLPMPVGSHHCEDCNACMLRYDHHCGVIGQCVADKNMKAFVLSFLYACIFGVLSSASGIYCSVNVGDGKTSLTNILILIASVYSGVISIALGGFGIGIVIGNAKDMGKITVNYSKFWTLFGDTWMERLTPNQKNATFAAWPRIFWNMDFEP